MPLESQEFYNQVVSQYLTKMSSLIIEPKKKNAKYMQIEPKLCSVEQIKELITSFLAIRKTIEKK